LEKALIITLPSLDVSQASHIFPGSQDYTLPYSVLGYSHFIDMHACMHAQAKKHLLF